MSTGPEKKIEVAEVISAVAVRTRKKYIGAEVISAVAVRGCTSYQCLVGGHRIGRRTPPYQFASTALLPLVECSDWLRITAFDKGCGVQ